MEIKNTKVSDHALALFTIFVWGITFVCTKELQKNFSSLEILFLRYVIAYIALWIMCPKRIRFNLKQELYFFAASLSGASLYQYLENLSVNYTSPASVSFITAMAPLFTALFAHIFLKEKLNVYTIVGMVISIVGVGLVSFSDSKVTDTGLMGDLIIFCSIWLWAVYSILVKKIAGFGLPGFAVTRRIFFYSILAMIVPMIVSGDMELSQFDAKSIVGLAYLGFLASAICFYTWNKSVDKLGAITTSKYLFVMPVITFVAQLIYNRGVIGPIAVVGMLIILIGLFVSEMKGNTHEQ